MMRKMRQVLALLLTAVMIVTVPTAAFGTPISDGVQAKGSVDIVQSVHNEGKGIYKLTATASTHVANDLTFAVSMSYDNTVVQPVRGDGQILNIEDESREERAFKKDCGIDPNDEYAAYFSRIGVRWVVDDTNHRTAFTLTMATTNYENGTSIATGMVMGEFYFKIKEGKGLNKGSFRIETPDYTDSQISRLFGDVNEQDAITLGLKTGVGQEIEKLLYGSKQYEDSLKASLTYDNNGEDVVKSLEISADTNQTIQVPALGATNTLDLDATAKGIYGDTMLGVGVVWVMSDTISGVTIDPETGVITVDYTAQSGNLVVTATAIGTTVSDTVNISIQRGGTALAKVTLSQASIEVAGGEAGDQTITAAAFDQYGAPCSGGTWSVAGSDAGNVTIDPASGVVTVKSKAKVGTYRVTVTKGGACAEATFQVTHTASIAKSLTILKGSADCASDAISKPVSGAAKAVTYTAKVLDQFDEVMERAQVVWSVKGTLPSNVTQKDGTIGVPANAVNGQFSLVATVKDSGISDTCQITITSINGDWSSITATTAAVAYGAKNRDLITGTASTQLKYSLDGVGEKFLTGAYAVVSGEAIQGAGTKKVRVNFTADNSESNGEYKNVVLTKEFNVTIAKKPIAVRVTDTDKIYGSANPVFGCTYSSDTLVGTDTEKDLAIDFNCEADATTDVGNTTLTIKPKKLTVGNGTIAITKVYDGTTGAGLLTGALVHNGVNGDQLTVTASAPTAYPNAQVGAGYSATFTITLGGSKAANYTLGEEGAAPITTGTGTLTSAAITPKALTITGATVEDKAYVYNGSKAATIAGVTFSGLMAGETLALGTDYKVTNATFASESVGQNIQVTATIALTTTEKAKHYSLADSALQTTGNIVKSTTEITGIEGKAQVLSSDYDKKSETTYTFDLKTLQIGATDILNIRYGAVSIAENTGGMIATNPTPTIENGILTFTVVPKAKDTTAKIAVVIKSDNYGDSRATITVTSMDKALVSNGMVFKDGEATYNGKTQTYEKATASGEGVNTVKPLLYTYTTENGQLKDNKPWGVGTYRVKAVYEDDKNYGEKTATFTITKASLRITAHDNTIVYGEMPTAKGVTYGGFVNGETETVLEGTLGYQYSYNQYGNVGDHYTITPTGYRAKNYEISYVPGNLTVRIKPLQVAAGTYQVAKAYDGTTTAGTPSGALSLTGLENNDVVTVTVGDVGAYKDKKASKNQSVPLSNLTLSGEKRGNYQLENTTFDLGTAVITPKVISNVTKGDYTITKEYDGTTTAGTPSGNLTMTEVIAGDQLGIATTVGTYDNKDVGTAHSVVVTLGNLTGDDCENYSKNSTLTTVTITNAAITRAAYKYTVSESQEIKEGSTLSAITVAPTRGTGKNGESISMVTRWYTDSGRTIEATDHVFDSLKGGEEITLYWSGKTSDTNYQQTAKTGEALFKIVEGNTQTFAEGFTEDVSKTYGDTAYTKGATLTVGTGTITYASSNKDVATVEATTGEVTLHKAGKAKITATAAAVPGAFVATEISYKLNVEQREVGLTWSGDSNLTYDNKAKAVIATVNNIVGGDTVNVTVQGGNAVNAGVYTAKGTALSNPNYKLPDSPEKSYTIAKADREFQIDHTEKILVGDELYFTIKGTTETDLDKSFQPAFKSSTTTVAAVNNSG
ncbi:MAG: YDG domain-containing protein, partial [Anaerovorax sp.]